jgi:DNA primase catalytic core
MAGLIPQTFIDDLLHRVDIVEVVDKRVSLKRSGKNYQACCPFHNEKTPSFSVQPEKQFYYCFGCGEGGNAIGFVMNFDHVDFPEAVETLARDVGLEVPRGRIQSRHQAPVGKQQTAGNPGKRQQVLPAAVAHPSPQRQGRSLSQIPRPQR